MYFLVSNATRHRYLHGSVVFRQTCTQTQSMYINKRVFFDSITSSFQSWEAKSTIFQPTPPDMEPRSVCGLILLHWGFAKILSFMARNLAKNRDPLPVGIVLLVFVKILRPILAVICLCLTFPSGNDVWGFGHKNVLFCGVSTTCQVLVEACLRREGTRRPGCKTQQGAFISKP